MKVSPQADYPIRVTAESAQWEGQARPLYEGIYQVSLNHLVQVLFVPDVSALAPPWDYRTVPPDLSTITTEAQARYASALLGRYVVTPNPPLAGTLEGVEVPATEGVAARTNVVWYVSPAEFGRYGEELAQLAGQTSHTRAPAGRLSELRGFEVVRFTDEKVAASPALRGEQARLLGKAPNGGANGE